jgi:hypothetical protein
MFRAYVLPAVAGVFLLSMATAAFAVTAEYDNGGKTIFIKDTKGNSEKARSSHSTQQAMPPEDATPGDLLRQQLYEGGRIPKVVAPQWGENP